jgi:hypothetical protein
VRRNRGCWRADSGFGRGLAGSFALIRMRSQARRLRSAHLLNMPIPCRLFGGLRSVGERSAHRFFAFGLRGGGCGRAPSGGRRRRWLRAVSWWLASVGCRKGLSGFGLMGLEGLRQCGTTRRLARGVCEGTSGLAAIAGLTGGPFNRGARVGESGLDLRPVDEDSSSHQRQVIRSSGFSDSCDGSRRRPLPRLVRGCYHAGCVPLGVCFP